MDIKDIKELIKFVSKSGVSEVTIEDKGFKLSITLGKNETSEIVHSSMVTPQQIQALQSVSPIEHVNSAVISESKKEEVEKKYLEIKSPMIGTFYRKSSPDKDVFVNVGDTINSNSVVCIIEAMKLFNEVEAEISGTIVKCLVEDGSPVEFDQPLFLVEP